MSMNRRAFIRRTILGGVGLALTPLVKALPLSNVATIKEFDHLYILRIVGPRIRDDMFKCTPFLAYLRKNSMKCNGGTSIIFPFKEAQ